MSIEQQTFFLGLNPGPCHMQFNDDKIWATLETRGFHF